MGAFPSVCPALLKDGYMYRDGGLLANNPSLEGIIEVGKLWPQRSIGFVHSIGMGGAVRGQSPVKEERRESLSKSVSSIFEAIAETGTAAKHTKSLLSMLHPEAKYRRIDLPLNHHSPFIKDSEEYKQIAAETAEYLQASCAYQDLLSDHNPSARLVVFSCRVGRPRLMKVHMYPETDLTSIQIKIEF